MADLNLKDGWKTTEFWLAIATSIFGLCFLFGVFDSNVVDKLVLITQKISGVVMTISSVTSYIISRSSVKKNTLTTDTLKELLTELISKADSK